MIMHLFQVKLIDLGMAGVYNESVKEKGVFGSPGFMAPEVIRGGEEQEMNAGVLT